MNPPLIVWVYSLFYAAFVLLHFYHCNHAVRMPNKRECNTIYVFRNEDVSKRSNAFIALIANFLSPHSVMRWSLKMKIYFNQFLIHMLIQYATKKNSSVIVVMGLINQFSINESQLISVFSIGLYMCKLTVRTEVHVTWSETASTDATMPRS